LLVAVAPKQDAYNTLPSFDVKVYFKVFRETFKTTH
jgi:hypothetical protein